MAEDLNQIGVLKRREIEARIVAPLLEAFAKGIGREKALAIAQCVIEGVAREQGRELAERSGDNSPAGLLRALEPWTRDGALQLIVLQQSDRTLDFNVTRCRYAELYRELGVPELGRVLSCSRDSALCGGFNPALRLTRTQTIMEGSPHCDFRFKVDEPESPTK
ncbi:MAG: L-2-amino-thiazoline-4-carboxylic acid hydrolase [Planctomycetota bacterium]|nr:L-2-amino-thiazoline-4-carboxylic acid hydrolase [Planctomycetota bacterium]